MTKNGISGNNTTATESSIAAERIEQLESELSDTNRTLNTVFNYIEQLEDRIEQLEENQNAGNGDNNSTRGGYGFGDDRDASVLDTMERGETYPVKAIKARYIGETDIRNEETLRNRVTTLCDSQLFEPAGHGKKRFVGGCTPEETPEGSDE